MNVQTLGAAVNLLAAVAGAAQEISSLITEAAANGRTTLSQTEWAGITNAADKAHQALEAALQGPATEPPASSGAGQ